MSTPAQAEFDNFVQNNNKDLEKTSAGHPDDTPSESSESSDHDGTTLHSNHDDSGDDHSPSHNMPIATYLPSTTEFDANTGPKGVIADARSFETAKKRSFRQTLYAFANGEAPQIFKREKSAGPDGRKKSQTKSPGESPSTSPEPSDSEDEFMRTWRANRLAQLASMSPEVRNTRRQSPSKRRFGSLVTVDPAGYLDAIEKVGAETVVVVLIYDDESTVSNKVEDALSSLAHKHSTTRFVKLHFLEAEMDEVAAPGILAYRAGDCFANLVSMVNEIPAGRDVNKDSVEGVLLQHRII